MNTDFTDHLEPIAGQVGNSGNSGNSDDLHLGDMAHEVLCKVIDFLDRDGDLAARTMLLATAWLIHDDQTFGRATAVSDMLLQVTREGLDAFHNPPPAQHIEGTS